ncbi:uncharacterized protein LOC123318046 isoform X2 [Coccinella septempunctata]|nr:uncharacterized protein LOC123318046 isoform X2 [Coccinella septempunctata]
MNPNPPSNITSITPNRKAGHLTVNHNSANERCPVCDRSFGPKAFDRHVEFCKEQKNRVQVHKSPAVVQQAKERLEARINYRVPPLRQSKRSLVRDKYSPSSQTSLLLRSNSIVSGKSTTSLSSSVTAMLPNRRPTIKNNEKNIERNNKKEVTSKTRLDKTIGDCGDSKELTKNENNTSKNFQTKRIIPAKKINKTEINDGLQGLKVSSLCVEKDKKLVTWKDTVQSQPKLTTSISLTSTIGGMKKKIVHTSKEEESRTVKDLHKVPSLGKVVRSRLLLEKLNKYVSKSKLEDPDPDELDLTIPENNLKIDTLLKKTDFPETNELEEAIYNDDISEISELAHISEEGEVEDESTKNSTGLDSENVRRKVSFTADCCREENDLNVTKDIENSAIGKENLKQMLNGKENFLNKYNISSDDTSEQEYPIKEIENEEHKDDSGDDTKTEDTSSLCLRLPLEGLESKVKLKNNDLDPEEKLKKNIKSFYEIMKTRRYNAAKNREQLCLLESSKDMSFHLDLTPRKAVSPISSKSAEKVEQKFENNAISEVIVRELESELETAQLGPEDFLSRNNSVTSQTKIKISQSADCRSDKKVKNKVASIHAKIWKRRKKLRKCRMCIKCFERNRGICRWNSLYSQSNRVKQLNSPNQETSEYESILDSPQTLEELPCEKLSKKSSILVDVLLPKSRSSDCLATEQSMSEKNRKYSSIPRNMIFYSLPNISILGSYEMKPANNRLSSDNSFDNVVPRKRRKISASYLNLSSDGERDEVQKNLKQNISRIRRRKNEEEPPLILNYQKIGLCGSMTCPADVLYMNEVFTSSVTPERSELESVNEFEDDGIQEYGDEELEEWEAAEEELRKEIERNKILAKCESPTKLSRPGIENSTKEERNNNPQSISDAFRSESLKTLKNSSACTIVNITDEKNNSARNVSLPILEESSGIGKDANHLGCINITESPNRATPVEIKDIAKIPCRLPRIIPKNKDSTSCRPHKQLIGEGLKLPAIVNLISVKDMCIEVDMPSDKLVQVPSEEAKESISFCQQTSRIMVDDSSSFNRQDSLNNAEEGSSPAITTNNINYDPFEKAHLQLMELIEDDNNSITSSTTLHSNTMSARSTPTIEFNPFVTASSTPKLKPETIHEISSEKRASVIDPPYHFQDNRASRDIEKEFELLESLMNNNLDEVSDRAMSDSDKRASIPSKYFPEEVDVIDPNLINAHDNLVIPVNLPSDEHSPNCIVEYRPIAKRLDDTKQTSKRHSRLNRRPTRLAIKPTTQPLPCIRPDQVRLAPDGSSAESQTRELRRASPKSYQTSKVKSKMRIDFSPESQKSTNSRRFGTSNLNKQTELDSRKGLAEGVETISLKEETFSFDRTPTAEELYPDNPMMYEEFRKYEEMYRREKKGNSSSSKKQRKKTPDFGINIEDSANTYGDSAYGSLSRKRQIIEHDSSDHVEELVEKVLETATNPGERLPKYCHECGNKYPVLTAKFCVECGVKRLIL